MESEPVYRRIYHDLLEGISSGRFAPGARLPSEKELCGIFNVSRITSKRALELLSDQGYIYRRPGKGSFVRAELPHAVTGRENSGPRDIGFILPDFSDSFGTALICGMEECCGALGYNLIIKRTRDRAEQEERAINSLSAAAGILILPNHGEFYNSGILKLILDRRAVVFVDRKMRGLAAPTITTNNLEAAEMGVEYLISLGHRNIAFLSGPITHTSTVEDRYQGFIRAFAKFGASHNAAYFSQDLSSIWTWPFYSPERVLADMETVRNCLEAHPEISAAFAAEYTMALVVRAAAEKLGRRIPESFSLLCFDSPPPVVGEYSLSHLHQDEYTIGKCAVETLHRIISGEEPSSLKDIVVPAKLIQGGTTGPYSK
jgi:DNA-binding LacI/PurR family transcriptional regulator